MNYSNKVQGMSAFEGLIHVVLLIGLSIVLTGFVIQQLWAWLIVPVFNLPLLTMPHALGLALVVAYFKQDTAKKETDTPSSIWIVYFQLFLTSGLYLGLGWAISLLY